MKKIDTALQRGFTAVELLITLFIASVFLFAGYQLYTQVTRDGNDADRTARLSNEVYERMRLESAKVTAANPSGCPAGLASPAADPSTTVGGVPNVIITVTYSCPAGTSPVYDLFLIDVSASFTVNGVAQKVEHATYAN